MNVHHDNPEFNRIELCGGIASGKTTLAEALSVNGFRTTFEQFRENPFWRLFYERPKRFAFETEVTFLLQHYVQIKLASEADGVYVIDSSIIQDKSYADLNLSHSEFEAFIDVCNVVERTIRTPPMLVHLTCPALRLLQRVKDRGRPEEAGISVDYLQQLNDAIGARINELPNQTKVLEIDSYKNDFAHDPSVQKKVINKIRATFSI